MHTSVELVLSEMMALALGQVRAGHPERMRSLYGPVRWADTDEGRESAKEIPEEDERRNRIR